MKTKIIKDLLVSSKIYFLSMEKEANRPKIFFQAQNRKKNKELWQWKMD